MYTAVHRPVSVQIEQSKLPDGTDATDIFTVRLVHQPEGAPQAFYGVYVPKTLQAALSENEVLYLQMEHLSLASSRALPFSPDFLVFALKTRAGETRIETPKPLRKALWWRVLRGGAATLAGVSLLFTDNHLFGAFWLVLGTHELRSAREMLLVPVLEKFNLAPATSANAEHPLIKP